MPVGNDLTTFEHSLVSVLENRPEGCEVIVPHDGSYDDPFDLGDEVRLIAASSNRLIDLIAASAEVARGRFVHVLAEGVCATDGWIDPALEKFEHPDAAAIAPVIRSESGRIAAAGWYDTPGRFAAAAGAGSARLARRTAARIEGVYLQASFWRREVLRSLADAFTGEDITEAAYAYSRLTRNSGWRCVVAEGCEVAYEHDRLRWETASLQRGRRLAAIDRVVSGNGQWSALVSGARALASNLLRPKCWSEAIGQMSCSSAVAEMNRRVRGEDVLRYDRQRENVIRLPMQTSGNRRRAA